MKILIIENNDEKYNAVMHEIAPIFTDVNFEEVRAITTAEASKKIYQDKFDLIIIDLMMPSREGEEDEDISEEIINTIESSEINTATTIIALSAFEDLVDTVQQKFFQAGILVVHYDRTNNDWRVIFSNIIKRIRFETVFGFVIVCALEEERQAFYRTDAKIGITENIRGLDCMHLEINGRQGVCIKPPRMGLVEASVISARAIELFKPNVISMSGICAGVEGESKSGQLVVADTCWEHQSGKWTDKDFEIEPYPISLRNNLKTAISQFILDKENISKISYELECESLHNQEIILAPMSSGSAVIASKNKMEIITLQQRKMASLDMEMYGVYKAAELSNQELAFFGAKSVVDFGDKDKGGEYRAYGVALSARFVVKFLDHWFKEQ